VPASQDRQHPTTLVGRFVVLALLGAFAVLVWRDPLYYYYDDALFYLQIGRSVALGTGPDFTPGLATNGYHPFWMLWCALVAAVTDTRWHQLVATAWLVVAMNAAWMAVAWRTFSRTFAEPSVLAGIAAGAGYVMIYGFGMESPLALTCYIACIAAALASERAPSRRMLVVAAGLAGMTVFARLDQAITLVPSMLVLAWRDWQARRDPVGMLLAGAAGAVLPAAWLAYNQLTFGAFTPISGMLKMSGNGGWAIPPASGVVYLFLGLTLLALLLALVVRRGTASGTIIAVAIGQIAYFLYLAMSGNREAYAWYFAMLAGSMALIVPALIDYARAVLPKVRLLRTTALYLFLALGVALFARAADRPMGIVRVEQEGPTSTAGLARAEGIQRIIVFDRPGMLAYLGGLDVLAADGLTSNFDFQKAVAERGLDWEINRFGIDGIAIPLLRGRYGAEICDRSFFGATITRCSADKSRVIALDFRSRLTGAPIGSLTLRRGSQLIAGPNDDLAIVPISDFDLAQIPQQTR
jgi:hypothetical protein